MYSVDEGNVGGVHYQLESVIIGSIAMFYFTYQSIAGIVIDLVDIHCHHQNHIQSIDISQCHQFTFAFDFHILQLSIPLYLDKHYLESEHNSQHILNEE